MGTATVDPEVIEAAFAKADTGEWWRLVSWQPDRQHWLIPSRTTPGESYRVERRRAGARGRAWWDAWWCSCPNEHTGRRVCWHKAAVVLRWRQLADRRKLDPHAYQDRPGDPTGSEWPIPDPRIGREPFVEQQTWD